MKNINLIYLLFALLLISCSDSASGDKATPLVVTAEVTRIVQVTTTPITLSIATPSPTLDPIYAGATSIAKEIGTPVIASDECIYNSWTQLDINSCSNGRRIELELYMAEMLKDLEGRYQLSSQERLEKFLIFQKEWEDLSKEECEFLSGMILVEKNGNLYYEGGSMAVSSYSECMVGKYEDRLRELQIQLFNFTHQ